MAQRRMFSIRIINSGRFLKMPIDSQLLYFHLGMRADDDGVVEAYTIMKMLGATEDNLKVLMAKGFIKILNEDLISYITDWREHNLLRADRKIDSIYKDLLLQVVSEVDLLKAKPRADIKGLASNGRPMGGIGKVRLGKDRISKDNNIYKKPLTREKAHKDKKAFTPPSIKDIQVYIKEKGYQVNAQAFYEYFTVGGWKDSKGQKVRNWKQKIITWASHYKQGGDYGGNKRISGESKNKYASLGKVVN